MWIGDLKVAWLFCFQLDVKLLSEGFKKTHPYKRFLIDLVVFWATHNYCD